MVLDRGEMSLCRSRPLSASKYATTRWRGKGDGRGSFRFTEMRHSGRLVPGPVDRVVEVDHRSHVTRMCHIPQYQLTNRVMLNASRIADPSE